MPPTTSSPPGLPQGRAGQRLLRPEATALPAQGGACVLVPTVIQGPAAPLVAEGRALGQADHVDSGNRALALGG